MKREVMQNVCILIFPDHKYLTTSVFIIFHFWCGNYITLDIKECEQLGAYSYSRLISKIMKTGFFGSIYGTAFASKWHFTYPVRLIASTTLVAAF